MVIICYRVLEKMISRRDIPRVCPKTSFVFANTLKETDIHGVCPYIEMPAQTLSSSILTFVSQESVNSQYLEYMVVMGYEVILGNDGLQGQQLSAQGNTLGNSSRQMCKTPCKGKSTNILNFILPFLAMAHQASLAQLIWLNEKVHHAFALSGRVFHLTIQTTGRCPGL